MLMEFWAKRKRLFRPIRSIQDAHEVLDEVGNSWYGIAVVTLLFSFFLGNFLSVISDAAVYAIAGYFLPRKKSRTHALFMFLLSLVVLSGTVYNAFSHLGGNQIVGGRNISLALLVAGIGWRGVEASFSYHSRSSESRGTVWRNVAIVWGATALVTAIFCIGLVVGNSWIETQKGVFLSEQEMETSLILGLLPVWLICFLGLPRRFPLTRK